MKRAIHVRPGLGAALTLVQEGGRPLRRVVVDAPAIIYVQSGWKQIRCGRLAVTAHAGMMVALSPGTEIEVTNALPPSGPYEALCLAFDAHACSQAENLRAKTNAVEVAQAIARPPEFFVTAFRRAFASCADERGVPDRLLQHQLHEVLLALELLGWRFDLGRIRRIAIRVRQLLGGELSRRWRIGEVGKVLGMSEATLRRRLEEEGATFRTLLRQVRMGHALALLQSSDLTVTQIADAAGYESVSQFTTQFTRHFGQSPRQLRQPAPVRARSD